MTQTNAAVLQDIDPAEAFAPLAYSPAGAITASGLGHNVIVDAMNAGELIARKYGRRTVILRADLAQWLRSLPLRSTEDNAAAKRAAEASVQAGRQRRAKAKHSAAA